MSNRNNLIDRKFYIGHNVNGDVYVHVEYGDKKEGQQVLSITGEIPRENYGQILDQLKEPFDKYGLGWDAESVAKLYEIWDRWHLNDMRAACEHQRAAGWQEMARENVKHYQWRLTMEYIDKQKQLQQEAIDRAASTTSKALGFSPEEKRILKLDVFIKTDSDTLTGYNAKYYEPTKDTHGYFAHVETERRGWVRFDEDPRGLLCKPCEVCGYRYGSAWLYEQVPADVIEWLQTRPKKLNVKSI